MENTSLKKILLTTIGIIFFCSSIVHAGFGRAGRMRSVAMPISLFAGNVFGPGSSDGTGSAASFNEPSGVAVDSSGNIYVADRSNHIIRKIAAGGVVTTFAGSSGFSGNINGTGTAARFNSPYGVAVDSSGNVYVADTFNSTIRKITTGGVVSTLAGTAGLTGSTDGTGSAARFLNPRALTIDSSGNIYVADTDNHTIRKITSAGVVTTVAGSAGVTGSTNATGTSAKFNMPSGIAVDSLGNLFVADFNNHLIRKITTGGIVSTFAGSGSSGYFDATGVLAQFNYPFGISIDSSNNLYVGDSTNHVIRKINSSAIVSTLAGVSGNRGNTDGPGVSATFAYPYGTAVDASGNVFVADYDNSIIRKVTAGGIVSTLAGSKGAYGAVDATGAAARFSSPNGITVDPSGNTFIADSNNNTIRKITPTGVVTTFAGTAGTSGGTNGTGAAARFNFPSSIAADSSGNLYVTELTNNTIRKITSAGVVTTLAGSTGAIGIIDGNGTSARFNAPFGIALDSGGTLFVCDSANQTIRKITSGGTVTTFAGSANNSGSTNGTGTAAKFNGPQGIAVDSSGNVFVADTYNHTIRKITSAGVVTTFAGSAGIDGFADGTTTAARFNAPYGLTLDGAGNLYVADMENHAIRKITPGGEVSTLLGVGGTRGSILGKLPGGLSKPVGVFFYRKVLYVVMENGVVIAPAL